MDQDGPQNNSSDEEYYCHSIVGPKYNSQKQQQIIFNQQMNIDELKPVLKNEQNHQQNAKKDIKTQIISTVIQQKDAKALKKQVQNEVQVVEGQKFYDISTQPYFDKQKNHPVLNIDANTIKVEMGSMNLCQSINKKGLINQNLQKLASSLNKNNITFTYFNSLLGEKINENNIQKIENQPAEIERESLQSDVKNQLNKKYQGQQLSSKKINKNPFTPNKKITVTHVSQERLKMLVIFLSQQKIQKINIFKQKKQQSILTTTSLNSFMDVNYTISVFDINKASRYKFQANTISKEIWGKKPKIQQSEIDGASQSYYNCRLTVFNSNLLNQKVKSKYQAALNHAIFYAIHFILKKVIPKSRYIEHQMFIWLRMFYQQYKKNMSQQNLELILSRIEMSKEQTVRNSQFFIYFLYAIYREKALYYFQLYKLYSKMRFPLIIEKYVHKSYPNTEQLSNFYLQLHLNDTINYPHQYGQYLVSKLIGLNIVQQAESRIFDILMTVAGKSPKLLMKFDQEIKNIFNKQTSTLCVHDYYNLRIRYMKYLIDYDKTKQQKLLKEFMEDLIHIYQRSNHVDCRKKAAIIYEEIQSLLTEQVGFMTGRVVRVGDGALPQLYSNCKILDKISKHQFNFMGVITIFMGKKSVLLTQSYPSATFMSTLVTPITELDHQLMMLICKTGYLHTYHIKQIISTLLRETNNSKYDTDKFQSIITDANLNEVYQIELDVILLHIDQLVSSYQNDGQKNKFLNRLFAIFSSKLKVVEQNKERRCYLLFNKFQNFLEAYFKFKSQTFMNIFINRIFSQTKLKLSSVEFDILVQIQKVYPKKHKKQNYKKNQHLINLYLQGEDISVEQMQRKIQNSLKSNPANICLLNTFHNFNIALGNIVQRITDDHIYRKDITQFIQAMKEGKFKNEQLRKAFFLTGAKMQQFLQNLNKVISILGFNFGLFQNDIAILQGYQKRFDQLRLVEAYKIDEKYEELFKYSKPMYILQQYNFWDYRKIKFIEDIIAQFINIENKLKKAVLQFQQEKISYNTFKTYFLCNNFKDVTQYYFQNQQYKKKIRRYNAKMNKIELKKIFNYSQSLQYIYSIIKSSDLNISFNHFNELVDKIENGVDFLAQELFCQMKEVETKLINVYGLHTQWNIIYSLSAQLQKQESAKIVNATFNAKKMFEMVEQKNYDVKSIADLKEYINDLENSVLKMETIKQFENVLIYWQLVKKSPNFNRYIAQLNELLKNNKRANIVNCIDNCFATYKLIQQKMDEAVNRQTSFKYEIQAIFKDSLFEIAPDLQIQITIQIQNMDINAMRTTKIVLDKENKQMIIDYKRMNQYKDKSILLINDIGRDQNLDEGMKEMMRLFERYSELFAIIEGIHCLTSKLSNYGYNPKEIQCQIHLIKGDIIEIIEKRDDLSKTSQTWLKGIKTLYSKSYLLTHFIGSELNKFIDNCINKVYSPSLARIINMNERQFKNQFQNPVFRDKILQAKLGKPLQRVQYIIQAFQRFQNNFMNSSRVIQIPNINRNSTRQHMFESQTQMKNKPIILLTCSAKEIYSCLMEFGKNGEKKISKPTQVLFCQDSTSAEQIEFFLDRAMICPSKTHFIIGAHNLKEQIKLAFCDQLSILLRERQAQLKSSQLCFIDDVINDKLYAYVSRPKLFHAQKKELFLKEAEEGAKTLVKLLNKTLLVTSKKPGLGKTFFIEQQAKIQEKKLQYFPVCGNIKFQNLAKRLKQMNLQPDNSLLIQIGHVQNKKKLEIFLSQIILFRCFYFQEYIFIPQKISIYIQIENIVEMNNEDSYHILGILKNHEKIHYIEKFDAKLIHIDLENYEDKFVYIYLSLLNKPQWFAKNQYSHNLYLKQKEKVPIPKNSLELLEKYFVNWFDERKMEPTFIIFKAFKNMLFNAFKSFSESPFLFISNFQGLDANFKRLQLEKSRENFLYVCISNSLQFLKETVTTNDFDQDKNKLQTVSQMISKFPMLIVSSLNFSNYQFIYLNDQSVDIPIKSLLLSQNPEYFHKLQNLKNMNQLHQIFKESSLSNCQGQQQQLRMFKILRELSGNAKFQGGIKDVYEVVPELSNYKLTLDNFFKMCLIIHRSTSFIPCIIMGQSGVGKTALIDFLVRVVYQEQLVVFNVHAGIHEEELQKWVKTIKSLSEKEYSNFENKKQQYVNAKRIHQAESLRIKRVWVFFDEFNTTDQLNYIKQMMMDRRFLGRSLPQNLVFLAACNPYRKRQQSANRIKAGIKKTNQNKGAELAFKVKPPTLSMIQLMWDYQQLGQKQNALYIEKMLSDIKYKKRDLLIKAIVYTHELFKRTVQVSSVSLRDVARFKQLYNWFLEHAPTENKKEKHHPLEDKDKVAVDPAQRAAILTFTFCYALRYSTNLQRKGFLEIIENKLNFAKGHMQRILQIEQKEYINKLKIQGQKIAYNSALMENVFTSLVCLMNKIPILIIGNPGSSKSLSIKMLNSNLRGQNSTVQFCKELPEINMIYYQGSEASTSKGVEQVFEKANSNKINNENAKWKILNIILFDEIGLAQKSIHNPLKVLHAKLQTNIKEIGFIGISNWELDAAKMSRFLVISRSNPDEAEVKDTAVKIYESYFENDKNHIQRFKLLGSYYYKFINKWNANLNNRQGFFGLRDFYSYIKYVCGQIIVNGNDPNEIDKAVAKAIQINFDGQRESLKIFRQIASTSTKNIVDLMNPIQLVNKNLEDSQSRCLMLIIRGDSLIPIINDKITIKGVDRQAVCVYGSTFVEDQQSEQYNLQVTSLIINHISRGNILAFKDINNSIQTSLYDLFNKSFSQIGNKKYCRIAVGANSNPKCNVHQNFNAIVYVDEDKLKDLDLAFLNRFEKHYLNLKSMIAKQQIQILQDIQKWINDLLSFRDEDMILKNQNFLINSSQESIVTLIIKYRGEQNIINKIKGNLLKNKTTDLIIATRGNAQAEELLKGLEQLNTNPEQCKEDMIIFTYDQFSNLTEENTIFKGKNYIVRLSEIKNQKGLRKQLKNALSSSEYDNVEIKVYYQHHYMHLNFLLFLAKQIKASLESRKQIIIIIQLHRFTLHQLNIQNINISYLHKFQQYFIEDIHSLQEIPLLLESKNCWQAYNKLNMSENFANYYMDALKLIRFKCQLEQIEQLKQMYFIQCLEICNNEYFKTNTEVILQQFLKKKKVDYPAIQRNAVDIMCCSNVYEAIAKYIGQMIKEVIFYSIRMVIEEGLLFYFVQKRSLKLLNPDLSEYLIQPYYKEYKTLVQFFHIHYEEQRARLITKLPMLRQQIKFQRAIQSNIVRIKSQITLISASWKDFSLLFIDKQNKGNKNLQEISSKIPLFKSEENEIDYDIHYENAKNFINTEFKISSHDMLASISKDKNLQKLYLNDLLTYCLKVNNQSQANKHIYIQIMVTIFEQFQISEKLIIFTNDKQLMLNIFEFFSLLFENNRPIDILEKIGQIKKKDKGNPLIELLHSLFKIGMQIVKFSDQKVKNFKSANHYISYFSAIYIKMRQIYINYKEYGLQFTKDFLTTNKLLEMFQKISINKEELVNNYAKILRENHTIYYYIYQFCSKLLEDKRVKEKEIIINFLSLDIFCKWLQIIQEQDQYEEEQQQCINSFVDMCNKYTLFANNSAYFISMILPQFDKTESIQQIMDYLSKEQNFYVKSEYIDMESNFTVALSNYISSQIDEIFAEELKLSAENQAQIYITTNYQRYFVEMLNNTEEELRIIKLFKIQFMKRYAFYYLQLLISNKENELQNKIDIILCQENQSMRHIRLYLLKHLYVNYQSFDAIKRGFIDQKRCKWILMLKQLLNERQDQFFVPPKILSQDSALFKHIQKLSDRKFADKQVFHDLVLEGLRSQKNRYQLLTYFMLNFYTKSIAENFIHDMKIQLDTRHDLKNQENLLISQLLYRYLNHKVMKNYEFANNEGFMKQISMLNYLNIVVSTNKIKNPLNDMFFNDRGTVNDDYAGYLSNRYLIGTMKNPALGRMEFILKRQAQNFAASSYINCSKNCDYISPVGGNFYGTYDGCANPYHQSKCAFCGNVIGAHAYNVLTNPDAKKFMPNNVQQMIPIIKTKKSVTLRKIDTNFEYNLLGYTLGNTVQMLKQSLDLKKHYTGVAADFLQGQSEMIHHKLLQSIINFVWYFLTDINFLKPNSLLTLFKYDPANSKIFLNQATNFYFEETNKAVKFANKNDYIIWHLGIGKLFLNQLIEYNGKNQAKEGINNLTNQAVRDNFQKYFEDFIFPYCEKEKEKLILDSRTVKTINKTDIIRELGNLKQHMLQYPDLKLFKLLKIQLSPSYDNMKRQYKETLAKNYPILSYLMNSETVEEKLKHFKNIYTFLSKLRKIFNLQITRQESKKPLNESIASIFKDNQIEKKEIDKQMDEFIKSWNRLAELKYQLKHQCHDFGQLTKIEKTYPLMTFLLDKAHMDNVEGRKLIGLLIVSVQEYNNICGAIQNSVKAIYSQQSAQIFSSNPLNPTSLSKDSKVLLFPTQILHNKIEQYSSFSVEYGISNPSYPFDQIQSMIAKEFYGCKFLISDEEKFCYINYIGEQVHFITQLREDENQKTLEQTNMKTRIKEYLKGLEREETFYKTIKGIQGSLENIVIFFKNFKANPNMHTMTIRNFINEKRIKGIVKELYEQPIQSLLLSNLADFYETIQFLTFEKVKDMLDNVYKKQLQRPQKQEFLALVRSMKSQNRQVGIPAYSDFKIALYRLAGRNLLLMMCDEKRFISQQLLYVSFYWPKDINIDYYQNEETLFTEVMGRLTISKVGDMLNSLPFKEREAGGDEGLSRTINNGRRIERVIDHPRQRTRNYRNREVTD